MANDKDPKVNIKNTNRLASYGMAYDIADKTEERFMRYLSKVSPEISPIANQIIGRSMLENKKSEPKGGKKLTDILKNLTEMNSFDSFIASNEKIKITLKDYDLIKRTLPQVYKILQDLHTAIMNPEPLSDDNFILEKPSDTTESLDQAIEKLVDINQYDINTKIESIVEDFLIISKAYYLITPYSALSSMLQGINGNVDAAFMLTESALPMGINDLNSILRETFSPEVDTIKSDDFGSLSDTLNLLEASVTRPIKITSTKENESLFESAIPSLSKSLAAEIKSSGILNEDEITNINETSISSKINSLIESFGDIEVIQGPISIYKDNILSEAASKSDFITNSSISKMIKSVTLEDETRNLKGGMRLTSDEQSDIDKLEINGCFIEKLNPSRVVPLIAKSGRKLGYFYVREDLDGVAMTGGALSGVDAGLFSSINSKLTNKMDTKGNIPHVLSMEIAKRILGSMDANFLKTNISNMDEIFEFVKEFIMIQNRTKKKVHFIHPDDMIEFSRPDGSIMKNCIVMARLAILLMVSNIMAKVTVGYDREFHYIDMGKTTDIAAGTEEAINAIIDGRITMDSITSLEHVFGIAGASTSVFIPRDSQGNRTIDSEIMSGQDINMDEDFIKFLIDSILLSFGVEPSAIDFSSDVNFAKTLAMVDIRIAKNSLKEQKILNPSIDKMIKKILLYELGEDFTGEVMALKAKLQPPKIVILEMLDEIFGTVTDFGDKLGDILISPDKEESEEDIRKRLFTIRLLKKYIPSLDIDEFKEDLKEVNDEVRSFIKERNTKLKSGSKEDGDDEYGSY